MTSPNSTPAISTPKEDLGTDPLVAATKRFAAHRALTTQPFCCCQERFFTLADLLITIFLTSSKFTSTPAVKMSDRKNHRPQPKTTVQIQ
jgi:hypothetical protein